jgi:hypothetical protein
VHCRHLSLYIIDLHRSNSDIAVHMHHVLYHQ